MRRGGRGWAVPLTCTGPLSHNTSNMSSWAATSPESAGKTVGTPLTRFTASTPGRLNLLACSGITVRGW